MLQYLVLLPDSYNDENTLGSGVSDFNSVLLVPQASISLGCSFQVDIRPSQDTTHKTLPRMNVWFLLEYFKQK